MSFTCLGFRKVASTVLLSAATLYGSLVQAGPVEDLSALLNGYQRVEAQFQQYTLSEDGLRQEQGSGHFAIQKPDLFDWVTEQPFPQRIVSDGRYIWIYDPDLEQVTRKPATDQAANAPSMILNGRIKELSEQFSIQLSEARGERQIYQLEPRDAVDSSFTRIRLLFAGEQLSELELQDNLGQRTLILLDQVQLDPPLDAGRFQFTPPDGIDLIVDPGA